MTSAQQNDRAGSGLPQVPSIPLTEDRPADAADQSIGALVKDATTHLSTLVRAEIELARIDIARDLKRSMRGSVFFMIALTVLLFSLFFFFFAIAELLADFGLPRSAAYGIVFGAMLLVVAGCVFLGIKKFKGATKGTQRTIKTAQETVASLKRGDDDDDD